MLLLRVSDLRKHFGPEPVLDGVSFEVYAGDRIGLVGPNGCGKTTLLRILAGVESADAGEIETRSGLRIGLVAQDAELDSPESVWEEAKSALADILEIQDELVEVSAAMAQCHDQAELRRLSARYEILQQELHRRKAFQVDYRVAEVLEGVGFRRHQFAQPVHTLSGGEKSRLALAKLLLAEPDVMLLDEPSNHLDVAATEWLEKFLIESRAAMILVSHDRYLLDRVTTRIFELYQGTVEAYRGNFSAYRRQKEERILVQRRTYERQQQEIARLEEFIRRNFYGQKHAQAEDRRKKLERIERVPPPREIKGPPMAFPEPARSGDVVLRAEGLTKGFESPLFTNLTFEVYRGQRWAILGPNGSGKTTLLKTLLGQLEPDCGRVVRGHGVKIAYFDQHLQQLDPAERAVDAVMPAHKLMEEPTRRDLLARFGITGDLALQPVGELSGGQRCRVALARLATAEANLLVLDEPTNHLDIWARESLAEALREFKGTLIFVSHDRHFIDQLADHLIVLEGGGKVRVFPGNYSAWQYVQQSERRLSEASSKSSEIGSPSGDGRSQALVTGGKPTRPRRKRQFPYRKTEDIERDIIQCEARQRELLQMLCDPEVLRHGERVKEVKAELEKLEQELSRLYAHWEEAVELNS
ncbi:MAG: ABC-F family ATP-binding cassette domain-containing protein [Thermoguttaceae bacterium]|nr:ABC-F family ATP-binding cassette domain-containing protein [Thermoguttaceae bacterium]